LVGRGYISLYPASGREYINGAILGTVSLAFELGKTLTEEGLDEMISLARGKIIFEGKIVDVKRFNLGGFAIGIAKIDGLEEYRGENAEVVFKNEYLSFLKEEKILSISPEIINLIDYNNNVVTSDSLRYGIKVRVLEIPVSNKWRELGDTIRLRKWYLKKLRKFANYLNFNFH